MTTLFLVNEFHTFSGDLRTTITVESLKDAMMKVKELQDSFNKRNYTQFYIRDKKIENVDTNEYSWEESTRSNGIIRFTVKWVNNNIPQQSKHIEIIPFKIGVFYDRKYNEIELHRRQ